MKKPLVIYYSLEGNTRFIGEKIAQNLNADLIELKPKKEIKSNNFMKFFWGGKQVYMKNTPELLPFNQNFAEYDNIFMGTPIWAWTYAPPIRTLASLQIINHKNLYLFCTHEGGVRNALKRFTAAFSKNNKIISTLDIFKPLKNKKESNDKVDAWLDSINT